LTVRGEHAFPALGFGSVVTAATMGGMDLEAEMLQRIRVAWEHHDRACSQPIKAILLNPGNHGLMGWDEVLGLPVLCDPIVEPKRFRFVCGAGLGGFVGEEPVVWDDDGRAWGLEESRDAA